MGARNRQAHGNDGNARRLPRLHPRRATLLALGALVVAPVAYLGISGFVARRLAFSKPLAIEQTPADHGLDYRDVSFRSRDDGMLLRGWLIPGIGADGQPTLARTVIAVHGAWQNRT